ncbi:hypothetical protein FHL15_003368 [Xylaria flabelliformis]|uniref:Fungal N-terminal domain-containing protein n=1 Tax=Xylaria flabelliformis TaxID=2512241 RepID=A0A553I6M9_9PEZI|nr:hypothetical protein FHL15_003368 [Xylaria flabelliformis]
MDPLSITTSVITLIGAASNIYNCLQSIRHADRGLQSLVKEISTLNGFLRSIETALEDCRDNPYALTHIDPALWKESKVALSDCQETLDQLGSVFSEPKRPSRSNTLFRRARVAAELYSRAGEIASFREKISMSNMSLQTLLQVINVSLSLRSNESHDNILKELKELKNALRKSSQAATVSYSTLFLSEKDARLVNHLKLLVRAAQDFHSSASVTASTVVGSGESQPPPTDFGDDDARSGIASRMPSMKREQIETYLSQNQPISRPTTSASNKKKDETVPGPLKSPSTNLDIRESGTNDIFSTIFTSGFSKIAQRALQQLDLGKAEGLLKEALKWHGSSGSDDIHHHRRLQTQLALCSLLQGNCQEAQVLILGLFGSSTEKDTVALQLLYALALLQLHELDFEGARDNSKRLWEALQRIPNCTALGANDAMKLLATSYQESGDSLLADAIEAELPDLRLFEPVPKMSDFLADCEELLVGILGLQDSSEFSNPLLVVSKIHDLPIAKKPSSLQMRELLLENASSPISESSPSEADDSLSVKPTSDFTNTQPKAKKRSWSNLRTLFKPRLWDIGNMDLYPLNTGAQDSTFKLRKKAKTSHAVQVASQEPNADYKASSDPVIQSQTESKSDTSTRAGSVVQNHDPESTSRTMEWVIEQTDNNTTDTKTGTTAEREDVQEPTQRLQRQFSFQAGVSDHISAEPPTLSATTCYEMPNNAVFELMDTSPRVKLPIWTQESHGHGRRPNNKSKTISFHKVSRLISHFDNGTDISLSLYDGSIPMPDVCFPSNLLKESRKYQDSMAMKTATPLETEKDIYDLLGCDRHSVATGNILGSLGIDTGDSSSGSESDVSSIFDQITPSTRQTTFNSVAEGAGHDSSVDEEWPPKSVKRMKSQRDTESVTSDESSTRTSFKPTNNYGLDIELDESLSLPRARESNYEATDDIAQPQSLNSDTFGRREFGPAIARLCRYRSPRKTAFRRRLPGSATTGLGRLFHAQDSSEDNFDFGFSNALYSGPDAVPGPFTDLEEADLSGGQGISESTPRDISAAADSSKSNKLDSRQMENDRETLMGETLMNTNEPPPYRSEDLVGSRKRSWTRTQIDDFFGVSLERPLFQPISCA